MADRTLDDLVNYQTWFVRGLDDGVAKERQRCLRIVDHYKDHPLAISDGPTILRLLRKAIEEEEAA
jgi:hypothetical protein